jgi:glucose/arabinose dehydrogenase
MLSPRYRLLSLAFAFAATAAQAQNAVPTQDQAVGQRFEIDVQTLPQPKPEISVSNPPRVVPRGDRTPRVPEGFTVTAYATGLTHPRKLLVLPNGDVIVAEQQPGWLTLLRDADGDGRAERAERHASGFEGPNGLAWRGSSILVADQLGVWAVPDGANASDKTLVTARGVFGSATGHSNRDIEIAPDGRLFVGVGSIGNIAVEPEPKATIQVFSAQGGDQRTFATGLRNPTDLAFHPNTGALWTVVEERDGMGDRLVPDYLTQVQEGAFYGWPYAYLGSHPQPGFAERAPEKVQQAVLPDVLFEAHSSAIGLVFYDGTMFPPEYRGDAFVALKGSWNRAHPTGYKIVRVRFDEQGRPRGGYENFATGFWIDGGDRAQVWGRPAALAVARDGALLVADDTGGTVWRIAWSGLR